MKEHLKNSHIFGIIGVCALVLFILFTELPASGPKVAVDVQPLTLLAQTGTPSFAVSPTSSSTPVGGTITVNVIMNTGGQPIYGFDLNMHFPISLLRVNSVTNAGLLPNMLSNTYDNTAGTIQFSEVAVPPNTWTGSGGTVVTIVFQALAAGTANVTIDYTPNLGTDSNIAGSTGDILGAVTNGVYTITTDTTAPTAPGAPTLTPAYNQVALSWTASSDNYAVTNYQVQRCSGSATCSNFTSVATTTTNSYTDTTVSASTIYRYRIQASDAAKNFSAYSTINNTTTPAPPDLTPPVISNLAPSNITTNTATVSWTTDDSSDTLLEYGLSGAYGQTSSSLTLSNVHTVNLTGLTPGTTYHYRASSKNANNLNTTSGDQTFITQSLADVTKPSVPTGLVATAISDTQIQLQWVASTDPAGAAGEAISGVAKYEVYRNNALIATVNSPSVSYQDTNLTALTTYSYQVLAIDAATPANSSAKTLAVAATTLEPSVSLAVQRRIILDPEGVPATRKDVSGVVDFLNPLATSSPSVYSQNYTTNTFGQYTVSVPSGKPSYVTMRASVPGYLARIKMSVNLYDTTTLDVIFPTLYAGDLVNDITPTVPNSQINSVDWSAMNGKWQTADPLADINRDGVVNTLDFTYLSRNYGKTSE